jgi:hypothetical protein
MRTWVVVAVTLVLGCGAGLMLTGINHAGIENHFGLQPPALTSPEQETAEVPKAVVEGGGTYDFGTLDYSQTKDHVFRIRNEGTAYLTLKYSQVSCGQCIATEFERAWLEPGEECEVKIRFATKKMVPEFLERLELATNDPQNRLLDLRVRGYVTHAVRPSVEELTVGAISGNEETAASFRVFGYRSERLEVTDYEFVQPGTADLFQVGINPLEEGEFEDEEKALVALEVKLTIKPGLPLGPISQTIRFKVMAERETIVEMPIEGKVVSDITIVGGGFNSDRSSILFGNVDVNEGAKRGLRVLVKGPYREDVRLSVKSVDPDENLQVRIGDVIRVGDGTILMYPLEIEILKGSPIINRLGTKQGKAAKVVLGTTHPTAKEVLIFPRFALVE